MPVFKDGWVCRACWKSNRPEDYRCYRCKTPREEQLAVEPGSLKARATPGWQKAGRMDLDLGILAFLVAWPMWLSGVLAFIFAVFAGLLALVAGDRVDDLGNSVRLVMVITTIVLVLFGMLWIFVSRSVRRQARWAYAIAILVYLVPALLSLLFPVPPAIQDQLPDWALAVDTVLQWAYLILGLMAVLLLATSFMRHGDAREPGQTADVPE